MYNLVDDWTQPYKINMVKCKHIRQKVPIGSKFVYCSSYIALPAIVPAPYPDLGIYFCSSWNFLNPTIVAYGVKDFKPERSLYPNIQVKWADLGTLPLWDLDSLIHIARKYISCGRMVDIACMGGHGRTGTFLACLEGKVNGWKAEYSMAWVKENYCKEAIEGYRQRNMIRSYLGSDEPMEQVPTHIVYPVVTKVSNTTEVDLPNDQFKLNTKETPWYMLPDCY
jgi:hypothetical protein